jgi:hypothetical protein
VGLRAGPSPGPPTQPGAGVSHKGGVGGPGLRDGLQGIVSKRLTAPYGPGRHGAGTKVKNPNNPAMQRAREGRETYGRQACSAFPAKRLRNPTSPDQLPEIPPIRGRVLNLRGATPSRRIGASEGNVMNAVIVLLALSATGFALGSFSWVAIFISSVALAVLSSAALQIQGFGALPRNCNRCFLLDREPSRLSGWVTTCAPSLGDATAQASRQRTTPSGWLNLNGATPRLPPVCGGGVVRFAGSWAGRRRGVVADPRHRRMPGTAVAVPVLVPVRGRGWWLWWAGSAVGRGFAEREGTSGASRCWCGGPAVGVDPVARPDRGAG